MAGPLDGIKILESTTMITGPLAGQMLGDLGAEITKVETPKGGDLFRTFRGGTYSPYFCAYNRNKKSVALDLRDDQGLDIYKKLVREADVLIENFRPGVMDRLGLSSDVLKALNPRLIQCSITGFGPDGPYKKRPAYDTVAQALSGMSSLFLGDDAQITGPTLSDNLTGIFACYGIQGALLERERTGVARRVEVNMLDSSIAFMPDPFLNASLLGIEPGPLMRVKASQSYAVRCADNKMIAIHMSSQEKFWKAMQVSFEREDLGTDPRFDDRVKRIDNYLELAQEFRATAATKASTYWMQRLEENDVPHAPVNTLPEVYEDPQVKHLDTFVTITHPEHGSYTGTRRPVYFDGSRGDQNLNPPPDLNEQGEEVLKSLGLSDDEIGTWNAHNKKLVSGA
ncbi:CaiB/BaiF CoA transferase family protein [Ruegeria arenilitoris]|uniref:CaiB/BaiF CoA transferase family protein n=1 Tax=Ruegeria arenilitoris TaxID=1173585 RepID=UPI001479D828|nr:CaiB/BaiF CoA-transferase family protein [Ruegeria arenilitoris]